MAEGEQEDKKALSPRKILAVLLALILGVGVVIGYPYFDLYSAGESYNVISESDQLKIYVDKEVSFHDLGSYMEEKGWISDGGSFQKVAEHKKRLDAIMLPGLQTIEKKWNNKELVNQLYLAKDKGEVRLTFNNVRLKSELAKRLGESTSASGQEFLDLLTDDEYCAKKGFSAETIMTMFLPDTYQVYYKSGAEEIIDKLAEEYKKFWTDDNKTKATSLGLTQSEISILASIVQAEQGQKIDEQPRIAGLYLNRIRKGMRLESDPTLVFANGDFSITWVKDVHKEKDSPYNTYMYAGLPPGPINLPSKHAVQSVLDSEDHDYIFMCAKPKTGGYHNFAKTYKQHLVYAREYQKWNRERQKNSN